MIDSSRAACRCRIAWVFAVLTTACSAPDTTAPRGADELAPQQVLNGTDDFEHAAAGALMIYEPTHPQLPGWRPFCSGALVHARVFQTAGHCIQFLQERLAAGIVKSAWISLQPDPAAHFNDDPAVSSPATGGWYEIESLHDNPDNFDFIAGMQLARTDPDALLELWGKFHDSGAIVLRQAVRGIQPMKLANAVPGEVERLLGKAGCDEGEPECGLLVVAYGLNQFPPNPPFVIARRAALLRYQFVDPLFIGTFDDPAGSAFGATCPGDSGAPVILRKQNGRDRSIVAISSSPADPFGVPCSGGAIQYRVDTPSHIAFINGVIHAVRMRDGG